MPSDWRFFTPFPVTKGFGHEPLQTGITHQGRESMSLIWFCIFGLIVGAIAKLIMPGKDPGGIFVTAIIGMVGSMVGSLIGDFLRIGGGDLGRWILAIAGTLLLLVIYRLVTGRRVSAS
jgi:uncharacterized membrane protein YeaQ/YmgE (transglycosylase-associated protein family)